MSTKPLCSFSSATCTCYYNKIFVCEFWTNEETINSNLALAICSLLLLPYLILYENTTVALVKDLMATALTLHSIIGLLFNLSFTLGYAIYILVLGAVMILLGGYGAIFREQKKLIDEIRSIE